SITLQANPNYYLGKFQFSTVTVHKVPQSATRVASLENGEADVVTALTPQEFDKVAKSGRAKVLSWNGNLYLALAANYRVEPWAAGGDAKKQRLLRQAIAYALPYDDIIRKDFFGRARKWDGLITSWFFDAKQYPGRYKTDVSKAKALLAEAGFPGGKGL